jgi:hypothetical protein
VKLHLAYGIVFLGLAGCSACGNHSWCGRNTAPPLPPPPPVTNAYMLRAHPLTPCYSCPAASAAPVPPNGLPPSVPPYRPLPDDSRVRLSIPDASPIESGQQGVRLYPPRVSDSGVQQAGVEERRGTPALPVIPQFVIIKDKVANGLKPNQEGVDWLNVNGYRAVLYLRAPGKDDAADRKPIEATGSLRYLSLEVSTDSFKDAFEQFNKLVGDAANRPLFVYDTDGVLAGGLWYLHLRLVDNLSDEKARQEAARIGLKEDGAGDQVTMWLAVQKYLRDQGK